MLYCTVSGCKTLDDNFYYNKIYTVYIDQLYNQCSQQRKNYEDNKLFLVQVSCLYKVVFKLCCH